MVFVVVFVVVLLLVVVLFVVVALLLVVVNPAMTEHSYIISTKVSLAQLLTLFY